MSNIKSKTLDIFKFEHFQKVFHFVCITTTTILAIHCSFEFSKNNDVSDVSFQKFGVDEQHAFPEMTLLFLNPSELLLETKLKDLGFDEWSYLNHLFGRKWNATFKDIDYERITKNPKD